MQTHSSLTGSMTSPRGSSSTSCGKARTGQPFKNDAAPWKTKSLQMGKMVGQINKQQQAEMSRKSDEHGPINVIFIKLFTKFWGFPYRWENSS